MPRARCMPSRPRAWTSATCGGGRDLAVGRSTQAPDWRPRGTFLWFRWEYSSKPTNFCARTSSDTIPGPRRVEGSDGNASPLARGGTRGQGGDGDPRHRNSRIPRIATRGPPVSARRHKAEIAGICVTSTYIRPYELPVAPPGTSEAAEEERYRGSKRRRLAAPGRRLRDEPPPRARPPPCALLSRALPPPRALPHGV